MTRTTFISLAIILVLIAAGCSPEAQPGPQTGRAVFTITDAAANMDAVSSIDITVDSVSAHSASRGWIVVSSTPKSYDLLELKAEGNQALLADANLETGTYEQVRLSISRVVVTDASGEHEARLPSGELRIARPLEVRANSTATATFDFVADESLHVTGKGEYILAPVVQLETRAGAVVDIRSNNDVRVGGGSAATVKVRMDISGNMGAGIGPGEALEIEGGKIRIAVAPLPRVSAEGKGRVIAAITDAAANMSSVSSIMLTVDSVSVHSSSTGWVMLDSSPRTYDLLRLKADGMAGLLADADLEPGTYQQIRLSVSDVIVTDINGSHNAKLPSGEVKINGRLEVRENTTATALFDFFADESLHMTGNGEYIFAPVLNLETREDATVQLEASGSVKITSGSVRTNVKVGMDVFGNVGIGLKVPPGISIKEGKIKIG